MRKLLIGVVKLYQVALSPFFGASCRFTPTCSSYAIEAINKHGAFRGTYLSMLRISHCHPWHEGGHDPVP